MRILVAALLALTACRSVPPEEPPIVIVDAHFDAAALLDSGDDSPCGVFCAHLAAVECPEANGACIEACRRGTDKKILPGVDCVSHATSRAEIQACGTFCR